MTFAIAIFLISSMSITIIQVNALDFSNLGIPDNLGQSVECVIVLVGCDGQGSVGSSGDTIIGSNNDKGDDDTNNGGNGGVTEPGTLTVSKEIVCESTNGSPSDDAVCDFAKTSPNYPQTEDFSFTVSGNNPNPSTFPASSSGTPVTIGAGNYTIVEEFSNDFDIGKISSELNALSVILDSTSVRGDCDFAGREIAIGTMTSGSSQDCTLVNTIAFNFGTVPGTLIVSKIVTCQDLSDRVDCEDVDSNFEPRDFSITVTGRNADPSSFEGSSLGTTVTLEPGSYSVTEDKSRVDGITAPLDDNGNPIRPSQPIFMSDAAITFSEDCSGTIEAFETKTCTITNPVTLGP
jgi:hypothetical protein